MRTLSLSTACAPYVTTDFPMLICLPRSCAPQPLFPPRSDRFGERGTPPLRKAHSMLTSSATHVREHWRLLTETPFARGPSSTAPLARLPNRAHMTCSKYPSVNKQAFPTVVLR